MVLIVKCERRKEIFVEIYFRDYSNFIAFMREYEKSFGIGFNFQGREIF